MRNVPQRQCGSRFMITSRKGKRPAKINDDRCYLQSCGIVQILRPDQGDAIIEDFIRSKRLLGNDRMTRIVLAVTQRNAMAE